MEKSRKTSPSKAASLPPHAKLIAACATLVAALLLVPSSGARAAAAAVIALAAIVFVGKTLFRKEAPPQIPPRLGDDASEKEAFALAKLFEATMNGMREGLLVVDRDMRVVASNDAARDLFPLSGGRLGSRGLTELTRNARINNAFVDALRGEERSGIKVEIYGPARRVFDLRVVPLTSANGQSTKGAIGVFFDITKLERLERVRQEFLSNVSHELRTPLTAILAFVETLEGGALNDHENRRRFLSIIRKNAARMQTLIDDILELSAIEAGNVELNPERVKLHSMIDDVFTSLATKAAARQIALRNNVGGERSVFADSRRLEQMLTNLVDNAIKFNRKGGDVTITCESGVRDRIIVEDTGEGIPSHHLERLFERFYRVDRARSRELGGTGLGLAIVKHLARAHGGEARVGSTLGTGSKFTIELPR